MRALKLYYACKPLIPRRVQLGLRRMLVRRMLPSYTSVWPICPEADKTPEDWSGWPDGKRFALVLTHDVDTARGQERCEALMTIEEKLGFRSAFLFVPERYPVSRDLQQRLRSRGFEVGVHGLNHDGKLYQSRARFRSRAVRINQYLREWGCTGFRSPAMHCNLDWLGDLDITYDASTFDTDPFEPQPQGAGTIFPFWVRRVGAQSGYVELPYTLPQDSTLFVMMKERGPERWKQKLDWVAERGGMALLNAHPDYMTFEGRPRFDTYPADYYEQFLEYVKTRYAGQYWHVLPNDLARFWAARQTQHEEVIDYV